MPSGLLRFGMHVLPGLFLKGQVEQQVERDMLQVFIRMHALRCFTSVRNCNNAQRRRRIVNEGLTDKPPVQIAHLSSHNQPIEV